MPPDLAPADAILVRFAQEMELVLVQAYNGARPVLVRPEVVQTAAVFGQHHAGHADAIAHLGAAPVVTPNGDLLGQVLAGVRDAKSEAEALTALYEIEQHAAASYQYVLERLQALSLIQAMSVIAPVEGQHAVVLGLLGGKDMKEFAPPFQSHDGAYDTTRFPAP